MRRQPCAISAFQRHGSSAGPVKGFVVLVEAGRCPDGDAPRDFLIPKALYGLLYDLKLSNIAPDTLPLVASEIIEAGDDVRPGPERHNVIRKYALGGVVVDCGAEFTEQREPLENRGFRVWLGYRDCAREVDHTVA